MNEVIIGLVLLSGLSVNLLIKDKKEEEFTNGFGFEMPESIHPIFLNMYKQQLDRDFGLFDIIQRLRYQYFNPNIARQLSGNKNLSPIIIIPGLGTSEIFGKWNKPDSKNIKKVMDVSFQENQKWSCRQVQSEWTNLWFPQKDLNKTISQYCWEDNIKVELNDNLVTNTIGVQTIIKDFGSVNFNPSSYMGTFIDAIKALGYTEQKNLFGACYDFRKICSQDELYHYTKSLKQLIERSVHLNGKPAVLVGHSLGSNLANYFLVSQSKEWKDKYINNFTTFSGAFGGSPKALRTVLSGVDVTNKLEKNLLKNITRNFTGLQWMLPVPELFNDIPLVHFNNVSYTAKDIQILMSMAGSEETAAIYNNVVLPVQKESLKAPGVTVYTYSGINLMTESSYKYNNSFDENPEKNHPYYKSNQAYQSNYDYPEEFNGDGTIPQFALELPLTWTKQQPNPIFYRFYNRAEHKDILEIEQPVNDFISILKQLN